MAEKIKALVPIFIIALALLLSGCAQQKTTKELGPEEVVKQFWADIGEGDYEHAYELAYHANQDMTKEAWVDAHVSKWGEKGSYIKIYSFNVTDSSPVNGSAYAGNFTEAVMVNTNATISYMGQNETGQLRMILVNTSDGWKVLGNY